MSVLALGHVDACCAIFTLITTQLLIMYGTALSSTFIPQGSGTAQFIIYTPFSKIDVAQKPQT